MPLDPSVLTGAGPKPIDIGSLIDMARGKQRLDAESSLGGIIGQATNPDGSIDAGKLGRLAPQAGVMAPEMAARAQQFQQQQNVIDHGKLDNYRSWLGVLEPKLYSLINDPDLNHGKVLDAIHSLVGHPGSSHLEGGMFNSALAVRAAASTYGPNGQPLDANGLRKVIGQMHTQVLSGLEASEPIGTYVDPTTGQRTTMTRAGAIAADAATPRPRPAAAGGAAPGQPAPGIPGARVAPGGGVGYPTAPPVGFEQAAKDRQTDLATEGNFGQEMFPWQQAHQKANELKDKYGTGYLGPGTKGRQDFASYVYGLSPSIAKWLGVDPTKVQDYAELDKYLTQGTSMRANNFGPHTNDGLATAARGTPNVGINDLAVHELIPAAMAVRRAEHIQKMVAAKDPRGPGEYNLAKAEWASSHDIRALMFDTMAPEARAKLLASLKPGTAEYAAFNRTLREAYDLEIMERPKKAAQ